MIERRIRWTRTARHDLDVVIDYITDNSIENDLAVLERLQALAESLSSATERGRVVPELQAVDVHQYREVIERPWRIVYRIEGESVLVLAVLDGRRDLVSSLLERLVRS